MTAYFKFYIHPGYPACNTEEIIEFEEVPSEVELEDCLQDYLHSHVDYGAYRCDKKGEPIEHE